MPPMHHDLQVLIERRRGELGFAGKPLSVRAIARRAQERGCPTSVETVRQLANGLHSGRIDDATVDALAAGLSVPRADVLGAMHETRQKPLGEWQLPDAAQRLTLRQRRALEQLIAAMVSPVSAADDDGVDLVAAGDEGMFVAQTKGSAPLSDNDRETNERLADQALDEMDEDQRTRRRFGGR